MFVMNSAPLEDYVEDEDEIMTPEIWRDIESKIGVRGEGDPHICRSSQADQQIRRIHHVAHRHLEPDLVEQGTPVLTPITATRGSGDG